MKPFLIQLSILLIGLGIGFYSGIAYINAVKYEELDKLQQTIKVLQDSIDSRDAKIKQREVIISGLESKIDTLNTINTLNRQRLQRLRKNLNDEINKIKTYSTSDIADYLDKRYSTR